MHNGRLSPELIAIIAEQLNSKDFFSFRLIARYLRDCSYAPFINRFFRRQVHLLSRYSLSALLEILLHLLFALLT
jgi:midasin (ATPase involved in ribosome maturation)